MTPRQRVSRRISIGSIVAGGASVFFWLIAWPVSQVFAWAIWWVCVPLSLTLSAWSILRSSTDMRRLRREAEQYRANLPGNHVDPGVEKLLLSLLSPHNRDRYQRGLPIQIEGSTGGHYLIRRGFMGIVTRVRPLPSVKLCAFPVVARHAPGAVETSVIAQLLMITTDERGYLRVAREYQ